MSIVAVVKKGDRICIAADTLANRGSMKIGAERIKDHQKIYKLDDSYMGMVGWSAIVQIVEHVINTDPGLLNFSNRMAIFNTLLSLQTVFKEKYFIDPRENEDQPVESNHISALIVNKNGIFEVDSYREVHEINDFWAIGSGSSYALGAMRALYNLDVTAEEIVGEAVKAAAEFDDGCGLPMTIHTVNLA
ncbi:MAG: hypothetical protein OEM02_11440 [Desulfobulbaceae bacterium]|nr:hypothetical protein [Desulfobulbaceae bacterium]